MQIKILVVDDSASDRLLIKKALGEYCILTADDGLEAIDVLEEHDGINILLLNPNTSRMNDFQVLQSLKENQRYRKLRTIILTDSDELDQAVKGLELGAVDYIRKPIQKELLKSRIEVHAALLRAGQAPEQQLEVPPLTFDMLFNQAPIGIAISHSPDPEDPDKDMVIINSVYEQITGRSRDELVSLGWAKITHPDDLDKDLDNFRKLQSGEIKIYSMDKRYIKPNGSIVWVHKVVAPFTLSNHQQYNHICLIKDITERKAIEKALDESERSKSVFLSHLPGLAYRCNNDDEWTMQYVSEGCFNLTGYPPESLLYNRDLSFKDIISPEYHESLYKEWERTLPIRQPFSYEYEIITATGERKWVLERGQGVYNEDGEVEALEGIVLDISDRKAVEDTLRYNYEHDRWTGLYNREYLVSVLARDIKFRKKAKKALVGISLGMMQLLTMSYGFQYSQDLIKKTAEALSQLCIDNRILFHPREYRFIFYLLDYKDKDELLAFSKKVAEILESLFATERIGGGIGILEMGEYQNETDIDLLLRRLLIASERCISLFGRDFEISFYDDELEATINRERDIVEALNAIVMDINTTDELFLQYQPIINLSTDSIIGFEALARLRTEKYGLVSPLEFIPIAEKTKLIIPIGEMVLVRALRFLNKLKERGYDDIRVSINISVVELLNPDFINRFFDLIRHMQVNPRNIGIEITESVFITDSNSINHIIEKLKKAGLHIAIDDFGTGYSSLSREKELEVDSTKIDKYFIDRLLHTDLSKAITCDIISMSHKMGHTTIAEGVEDHVQLQYLREYGCDKVQGYLISKPLDEKDAIEFLDKHEKSIGS
jgi:PAS domain S-box-containing protein